MKTPQHLRHASVLSLPITEDTPDIAPGDTIHLEATLTVHSITHSVDGNGEHHISLGLKPIRRYPAVCRVDTHTTPTP